MRRLPGRVQLAGIGVGFLGIVAISWEQVEDSSATLLGTVLVLVAVTLYGLAANVAVPLQQRYTILTANGGVGGMFGAVNRSSPGGGPKYTTEPSGVRMRRERVIRRRSR